MCLAPGDKNILIVWRWIIKAICIHGEQATKEN